MKSIITKETKDSLGTQKKQWKQIIIRSSITDQKLNTKVLKKSKFKNEIQQYYTQAQVFSLTIKKIIT